jgi:large conductance mechanosensitive channel
MKSVLKEFQEFAIRGNVIDMAVGVVIGGAFGKIITSLVNDVIMPPIGKLMGNLDFSNLFINLSSVEVKSLAEAKQLGVATLNYGLFLNTVIDFTIVAFAIFLAIKQINRFMRQAPAAPAATPDDVLLLREIRDLLKQQSR